MSEKIWSEKFGSETFFGYVQKMNTNAMTRVTKFFFEIFELIN